MTNMGRIDLCTMMSTFDTLPSILSVLDFVYEGSERVDRTLRRGNADNDAAFLQGCLPLFLFQLPEEEVIARLGQDRYEQLRSHYREMSVLNLWYMMDIELVLKALRAATIPVLVLKGIDVASTLYPSSNLRYFNDVDLMVHPMHLEEAIVILERLGYSYHQEYRFEEISKQRAAFVYTKPVAAGYLMFELHTSPHMNELSISFDVEHIWQRARTIEVAGVPVNGMSLEDLLLYLCWHYRSHSFERLIWLYDIAMLLNKHATSLDWGLVYRLARQQGLSATVYYVLSWCQELWRIALPDEVGLARYAPPRMVQYLIQRLIGPDTSVVLRSSQERKRKLLQHLMVDTLWTFYVVELRVLFPSQTHLGRLYMEESRLPLHLYWLYYAIHPLIALRAAWKVAFPGKTM